MQIALFQRLYYQKTKQDPEFVARKNEKARYAMLEEGSVKDNCDRLRRRLRNLKQKQQPKKPPINDYNRNYYNEELKVLPPNSVPTPRGSECFKYKYLAKYLIFAYLGPKSPSACCERVFVLGHLGR